MTVETITDYSTIKLRDYFQIRYAQFLALSNAEYWFEKGNETNMWQALIVYADNMYESKQLFDTFTDDEIVLLIGARVPVFILGVKDETS